MISPAGTKMKRQEHRAERPFDERCQPEGCQETDDDGRDGRHDLDGRLDHLAQPGPAELAGVDGAEQGQRHGQQHGVEGALEGAEDQRGQAELRLEIVAGRGRLPGEGGLVVTFVPDLAEQG